MKVYTVPPMVDPRDARTTFPQLEAIGYDGAFSFEAKLDPFLPLVRRGRAHPSRLRLGTAIAIAFARSPMNLANLAHGAPGDQRWALFVLGSGLPGASPHIEKRFSMPWSQPAARMREIVQAIKADLRAAGRAQARARLPRRDVSPTR